MGIVEVNRGLLIIIIDKMVTNILQVQANYYLPLAVKSHLPQQVSLYLLRNILLPLIACILIPVHAIYADEQQDTTLKPPLFTEILVFAQLSESAYESRDAVVRFAKEMGSELTMYEQLPGLEVTFLLLTDKANKTQWIAIRGTVTVMNTLVNLDVQLRPDNDIGIQLHSGFAETAKTIFQKITPELKKEYVTKISGHSLGGAVATILAMYLDINSYSVARVVTFGQPKITNITGAQKFSHLDVLRVVTARDYVPLLPPVDVVDMNNIDIYWPLGQEIILLDNNEYSIAKGLNSMLRATKFFNKQPDQTNFQAHRIEHYLQAIKNRQQGARWIPYKNDFSIFSIFSEER